MNIRHKGIFILISTLFISLHGRQYKPGTQGVCIVPVADLVGQSIHTFTSPKATRYETLPLSTKRCDGLCPRVHQLLFNEIVEIKEEHGDELLISVPYFYYETQESSAPHVLYWTLKKNIMPLATLSHQAIDAARFPAQLPTRGDIDKAMRNTVTLTKPFFDTVTQRLYSAGTRFVIASPTINDDATLSVFIFNSQKNTMLITTIPQSSVITYDGTESDKRIEHFLKIVTSWAHLDKGFIPYVWGGCSFTQSCFQDQFHGQEIGNNIVYERSECTGSPHGGFDCAGLISRAAQLAGLPYFYKNSLTIAKKMAPLQKGDLPSPGDIIWIPAHVMIVSSLTRHSLIEARSYMHGYGKVHEIPLSEEFKGIKTYRDLANAYQHNKPLVRLDRQGKIVQVIPEFKILRLASVLNS